MNKTVILSLNEHEVGLIEGNRFGKLTYVNSSTKYFDHMLIGV